MKLYLCSFVILFSLCVQGCATFFHTQIFTTDKPTIKERIGEEYSFASSTDKTPTADDIYKVLLEHNFTVLSTTALRQWEGQMYNKKDRYKLMDFKVWQKNGELYLSFDEYKKMINNRFLKKDQVITFIKPGNLLWSGFMKKKNKEKKIAFSARQYENVIVVDYDTYHYVEKVNAKAVCGYVLLPIPIAIDLAILPINLIFFIMLKDEPLRLVG